MADVILIAVSLALAAYYVIRLFKFFPGAAVKETRQKNRICKA